MWNLTLQRIFAGVYNAMVLAWQFSRHLSAVYGIFQNIFFCGYMVVFSFVALIYEHTTEDSQYILASTMLIHLLSIKSFVLIVFCTQNIQTCDLVPPCEVNFNHSSHEFASREWSRARLQA